MSAPTMKFGPGRSTGKENERRVFINVMDKEQNNGVDKKGFPVWLNEIKGGKNLVGHKVTMFLQGKEAGKQWFELSGPIRVMNEDGTYKMEKRVNGEGVFVNDKGVAVVNETDAADQYVYVKDSDDKIVHGKMGSINVVNTRKEKGTDNIVPTKSTYLSVKLFTDLEAYKMAQTRYRYVNSEGEQQKGYLEQLNTEQKQFGAYTNMFINSGAEKLMEIGEGFEVRTNQPAPASEPTT